MDSGCLKRKFSSESSHRILISPSFSQFYFFFLLTIPTSFALLQFPPLWTEPGLQWVFGFNCTSSIIWFELCAQRTINIVVGRERLGFIGESLNLHPQSCSRPRFGALIYCKRAHLSISSIFPSSSHQFLTFLATSEKAATHDYRKLFFLTPTVDHNPKSSNLVYSFLWVSGRRILENTSYSMGHFKGAAL